MQKSAEVVGVGSGVIGGGSEAVEGGNDAASPEVEVGREKENQIDFSVVAASPEQAASEPSVMPKPPTKFAFSLCMLFRLCCVATAIV